MQAHHPRVEQFQKHIGAFLAVRRWRVVIVLRGGDAFPLEKIAQKLELVIACRDRVFLEPRLGTPFTTKSLVDGRIDDRRDR